MGLRILAIVLRALFIGALVVLTVRVSSPQSESFASVYETPGDLIRLAPGFVVCLWIVIHLFMPPRTVEGYRTWVYLGLVVAPARMGDCNHCLVMMDAAAGIEGSERAIIRKCRESSWLPDRGI
jgi:hypothetical protein